MAMPPSLLTERLVLTPRAERDFDAMVTMHTDPEVMLFIGTVDDPVAHRVEPAGWLDDPADTSGHGGWTVRPRDEPGRYLGWVILYPLEGWEPEVEIGWRFVRDAWGRGYATEAAHAVLEHGFLTAGLTRICAVLDPENDRSRRVCEKLGMTAASTRRAYDLELALYVIERS